MCMYGVEFGRVETMMKTVDNLTMTNLSIEIKKNIFHLSLHSS